jgi:enoyl-CoA hydratase
MSTVRSELRGEGVLVMTLDKPPANAIDERLLRDLETCIGDAARDDRVRAVVLTGAGALFSGGFDFAVPRRDDAVALDLYALYRESHLALLSLPKPTVAMVNGHAVAGGLVLVLACDFRLARRSDDRFGFNEIAVGASFPCAAFEIVRVRLTHAAASELLLGAALYPFADGLRLGVFDELVDGAQLERVTLERAARLAAYPRDAYAHTKAALVSDAAARIRAETQEDAMRTMSVWISDESRAARRKQREKLKLR